MNANKIRFVLRMVSYTMERSLIDISEIEVNVQISNFSFNCLLLEFIRIYIIFITMGNNENYFYK